MNPIIIEKCEITSFGGLKNRVICCTGGINLISAPNESGKTTLAHFIKFVFYGFSGQRSQSVTDNEKKHYIPWGNPRAAGAVVFTLGGMRYRVEREYLANRDVCTVTEADTGREIMRGSVPGERFFGVSEEVFSKTLFFRQLSLPSGKDELLAEQLRNLASSADEEISSADAQKKLSDARNRLRSRLKTGLLPSLEKQREELESELTEALSCSGAVSEVNDEILRTERKLRENARARAELNEELAGHDKYDALCRYNRLRELARGVIDAETEYKETLVPFGGAEPDPESLRRAVSLLSHRGAQKTRADELKEASAEARRDLDNARKESLFDGKNVNAFRKKIKAFKGARALVTVLAVLMVLAAVGMYAFREEIGVPAMTALFPAGAAVLLLLILIILNAAAERFAEKNDFSSLAELEYMLGQYPSAQQEIALHESRAEGAESAYLRAEAELRDSDREILDLTADFVSAGNDVNDRVSAMLSAGEEVARAKEKLNTARAVQESAFSETDIKKLAADANGASVPARPRDDIIRSIEFIDAEDEALRRRLRDKEGEKGRLIGSGGDPALITAKRDSVVQRIKALEQSYKALTVASDVLAESDRRMRNSVSPLLSEYAGGYMSQATCGRYSSLSLDTSLSMSYETDTGTKSAEYMSAGTRDSAYMCLRLALVKLLYADTRPPLILDDAFVRLDGDRLGAMIRLLASAAEESQVFILTCHDREEQALISAGVKYDRIVI